MPNSVLDIVNSTPGTVTSYTDNGVSTAKWYDYLLDPLDLSGKRAASTQAANQLALDNSARAFSSNEAEKQRRWEEKMSNTAIQREVADFKAAGLNPWLAVQRAPLGASTPTGSSAQSNSGQANKADNKLAIALGAIVTALRIAALKH